MATIEDQIELERTMMQSGKERYHYNKDKMLNKGLQGETAHGRTMVYRMMSPLVEGVVKMLKDAPPKSQINVLLRDTDPAQIAYLSLIGMVNALSRGGRKLAFVAKTIGMRVETQIVIDQWMKAEPEVAKTILNMAMDKRDLGYENKRAGVIHKMLDMGHEAAWSTSKRINVGTRLVGLMQSELGIIEVNRRYQKEGKRPYFVEVNIRHGSVDTTVP